MKEIENNSDLYFMYDATKVNVSQNVNVNCDNMLITEILDQIFENTDIAYKINNRQIALRNRNFYANTVQSITTVRGKVTSLSGEPNPGATVIVKGTTVGTVTDNDGFYTLSNVSSDAMLAFLFCWYEGH